MAEVRNKKGINKGLILFLVLVFIVLATNAPKVQNSYKPTLQGTYLCDKLPFASITFDEQDDHAFIYENFANADPEKPSQELDEGKYSQKTDTGYIINSPKFNNIKIIYNKKGKSFKINIDGETYIFKQSSPTPIINLTNYE